MKKNWINAGKRLGVIGKLTAKVIKDVSEGISDELNPKSIEEKLQEAKDYISEHPELSPSEIAKILDGVTKNGTYLEDLKDYIKSGKWKDQISDIIKKL